MIGANESILIDAELDGDAWNDVNEYDYADDGDHDMGGYDA